MSELHTRRLTIEDLEQFVEVRVQAFGISRADRENWIARVDADAEAASFGTFDGTTLLGALRVLPGAQWWLGRSVPMGGVAAVVVRPEARARGVARSLLFTALEWMRDEGIAVSALHPASTRVYRSAGWELAGIAGISRVPTRSVAAIRRGADLAVVPLESDESMAVRACYDAVAQATHGMVDRSSSYWLLRELSAETDGAFTYGVRDTVGLRGYVRYHQESDPGWGYRIAVDECVAGDVDAAAALWRFLGAHAMQAEHLEITAPCAEQLLVLLDEQDVKTVAENRWMTRIVDLERALAARGYLGTSRGEVTVRVTDPWPGGISGTWEIEVADGEASVRRTAGDADVTIDVGALSALNIGRFTASALARAGRLTGSPAAGERLGALLAAPLPQISDDF